MQDSLDPRVAAARLLDMLGADARDPERGQTSVDGIAARLGLDTATFHPATRRSGTLGWLEPGENLIFLRDGIAEPIRRFTLAHEIGHYVLHRQTDLSSLGTSEAQREDCDDLDLESPFDLSATEEALRPGQVYSVRAHREAEANAFASALLLPPEILLQRYLRGNADDTTLRALTDEFGVSEDVLLRQLSALLTPSAHEATRGEERGSRSLGSVIAALDPGQRAAAESETPALVIAGPGTGKTSTLVARAVYLIHERKVPTRSMLALTFSNKAATEMRERLRVLLAPDEASVPAAGENPVPLPTISTMHAFCGNVLRLYGPLVGLRADYRLVSEAEGFFLLRDLSDRLYLRYFQPLAAPAANFPALLASISRAKDDLLDPAQYEAVARARLLRANRPDEREAAERTLELAEVYRAYQQELQQRGDADFGDLISLTVRLFAEHPDVLAEYRARYQHVLVDEFQDINHAMSILLRQLAGGEGRIWAVGDADQAIYRFRGASPGTLAEFSQEYPGSRIHTLQRNFRSAPQILEVAHAVAQRFLLSAPDVVRLPLDATRDAVRRHTVSLALARDEDAELAGLIQAIRARHEAGRALGEQAVLCRTRRQCQRIAAALTAAGLRAHVAVPLLEQDLPKDILAVLSLVDDVSGSGLLRAGRVSDHTFTREEARACISAAHASSVSPLALLRSIPSEVEISPSGREGMSRLSVVLADLRRAPSVALGLSRYIFSLTSLGRRLLAGMRAGDAEVAEAAVSVERLISMARAFDDLRSRGNYGIPGGADYAAFLDYVRVVVSLRQDAGATADSVLQRVDGVRVLTVHASKGLEFPVVYLPELADRKFPTQRRYGRVPEHESVRASSAETSSPEHDHIIEEASLFYVAITRARDELVLSRAERYGRMRYRPSPFLEPVVACLGERLHQERWNGATTGHATPEPETRYVEAHEQPDLTGPLQISALETYSRCPRQFAYRYIYGLQPREIGLGTLRRCIHGTLAELHRRMRAAQEEGLPPPTQEETERLFEEQWAHAVRSERAAKATGFVADPELPEAGTPQPFLEFYRRHGRRVIRRSWAMLTGDPADAPRSAALEFDRDMTVRAGDHDIALHLDAIEREPVPSSGSHTGEHMRHSGMPTRRERVRLVRHRLGESAAAPDLRTLLYALAAEQENGSNDGALRLRNLTTGVDEDMVVEGYRRSKLQDQLEETIKGIESGVYPPKPDQNTCQNCPFLLICPA